MILGGYAFGGFLFHFAAIYLGGVLGSFSVLLRSLSVLLCLRFFFLSLGFFFLLFFLRFFSPQLYVLTNYFPVVFTVVDQDF